MKLYISRDELSDNIWLWLKPNKGAWKPEPIKESKEANYQRIYSMDEIDTYCCYDKKDFKQKFGISINKKTVKCVNLPDTLVLDNKLSKYPLYVERSKKNGRD